PHRDAHVVGGRRGGTAELDDRVEHLGRQAVDGAGTRLAVADACHHLVPGGHELSDGAHLTERCGDPLPGRGVEGRLEVGPEDAHENRRMWTFMTRPAMANAMRIDEPP